MSDQESNHEASSLGERFNIDDAIRGLAQDLKELRAGKISVENALTRAALARQMFNGVRLVIQGQRMLAEKAKPINVPPAEIEP